VKRRVVIAPNWLGDCVMALPFLKALRAAFPADSLAVLSRSNAAPLFSAEGSLAVLRSQGHGILRLASDAALLRRGRYDEAWILPNSFRSALLAFLAGIPSRIGYATDRRSRLLTSRLPPPPPTRHQLRDYDALLEHAGVRSDAEPPRLEIPEAAAREISRMLALWHVPEAERPIFLAPGAAFGATKRWPAERFALLADALMDRGHKLWITIGPGEETLGRLIARRARHRIPVVGGDMDALGLAALLARGALVIANDSGPMHLAGAVGTPVLAFFGPTDPGRTGPMGSTAAVIDRYVSCSPCYRATCPYGHECMEEITVEMALEAAEKLLPRNPRGAPETAAPRIGSSSRSPTPNEKRP
jgi:lipopolysaccharide heptosyltransferase II